MGGWPTRVKKTAANVLTQFLPSSGVRAEGLGHAPGRDDYRSRVRRAGQQGCVGHGVVLVSAGTKSSVRTRCGWWRKISYGVPLLNNRFIEIIPRSSDRGPRQTKTTQPNTTQPYTAVKRSPTKPNATHRRRSPEQPNATQSRISTRTNASRQRPKEPNALDYLVRAFIPSLSERRRRGKRTLASCTRSDSVTANCLDLAAVTGSVLSNRSCSSAMM